MIASWMATAMLFALLLGVAAAAAERALRTLGRAGRGAWMAALAAAVAWPLIATAATSLLPGAVGDGGAVVLPSVRAAVDAITPAVPTTYTPWAARADTALLVIWAVASALLLVRLALALRSLSVVERAATRDVIAGVAVLVTPALGPAVFGAFRPRLLVPQWLCELDAPLRELVMRHETEHCRAGDQRLTLGAAIAVAIMPWNPGVWWIGRRLRLALEMDCDARVLRVTGDTERYARLLLFIAQRQSRTNVATMLAESSSDLSRRITEMKAPPPRHPGARVAVLALAGVGALACSARYGTDLATAPSSEPRAATYFYFSPEGARPASQLQGPGVPAYPTALANARIEGEVLAQFVVDTGGLVMPGSLKVLRSTDAMFTEAVRSALPDMRFIPPEMNGRKTRQLVQQSFFFDLRGSAASAARMPQPVAKPTSDPANRNPMPLTPVVIVVP